MNTEQAVLIVAALDSAHRAGFAVSIEPAALGRVAVTVKPVAIRLGKASSRVEAFTVVRDVARDALGNALGVLTLEIGADLLAAERAAADAAAIDDTDALLNSERDLRPCGECHEGACLCEAAS
jgi:hypothetical protein